jgi:sporulation protein YqfC
MMGKDRKKFIPKLKEKVADVFELPKDVILDLSKVIIYGNRVAIIENFVSLTDYDSENLVVKTDKGTIRIRGRNLVIKELSEREMNIKGEFLDIELCKKG